MNLLTLDNITKTFTDKKLLDGVNFYLQEGEKVGVIGINGTGKSTLLKIMAGLEEADGGSVTKANHVMIRFLSQHPVFAEGVTVLEAVMDGNENKENKWSLEASAKSMLNKLGITEFDKEVNLLSGGQKKRVSLANVLLSPAEILILDEPTNHLDNSMADWLEEYLKNWKGALVMVTHDRYFLDSVSNRIVEIDKGALYSYSTNYSGFLTLKAEREEMALAGERKRQTILRNELAWIQRGARARSTKQKARIERFEQLRDAQAPKTDGKVEMSSISTRLGKTTIELNHISKAYGEKQLFKDFNYIFLKGDRVGFLGENGCGKTTLMKIIAGRIPSDEGEVVVGQTVKSGYYTQEIETVQNKDDIAFMNPEQKVIDYIKDVAEFVQTTEGTVSASKMLERFLFEGSAQYSLIGKLSGGEKRRLNLLRVLMEAPNVLILDEPTNDLDIETLTILEDYLDSFDGIVITVSHDRYFLDRVVRRIFAFEGHGNITQYEGGYTDYQLKKEFSEMEEERTNGSGKEAEKEKTKSESAKTWGGQRKLKFSYNEQKEYDTIEKTIADLEEKLEWFEQEIAKAAHDFVRLNELTKEQEETRKTLEEKMERWMYLEELAEKIKAGE
ncbi:MAG: ABC-F family ATP-binding cassette domain-containing protein [Lachnospiraceae bacterium]|nr:ABC-F family ATP-binding cassette domain-containing protein [Lachnospiraceae bacterium]